MTHNHNILLFDKDSPATESLKVELAADGFGVEIDDRLKKAKRLLLKLEIDLAIIEISLPGSNELMEFINEENLDVAVVVCSVNTDFDQVTRAFRLGAFDYIQKPCSFEQLRITLRNAIRKLELDKGLTSLRSQLEQSERLHRFMIESSPDIIFIVDRKGHFAFANDRAEELLNYKKDELIGSHYSTIVDSEYLERASYCFNERRAGPRATRDAEIWLMCKPARQDGWERDRIAIEMNSLGVYENETRDEEGNVQQGNYSGTYIVARDITERLASEKLIHFQAYHDLLTGLPNRALFYDRLSNTISNARREDDKLAVLFLDLDRFKVINDTLGHSIGDNLLKQIATRLKSCLREGDTVARLGGDEFIVLLPHIESTDVVHVVGKKLVNIIKKPFTVDGNEIFVTGSIGIAIYPEDGGTTDLLIKHSDTAMYFTKEQGKDNYCLYDKNMSVHQSQMLNMEADIRRGLRENQFEVYYQPQVNPVDGGINGVEALLRWNHPEKGLLSPVFFMAVAEEAGTIVELGDWVLETAVEEVKTWLNEGLHIERLAINFSSKQIEKPDFVDKVIGILKKHDFPGSRLEIEITESMLMNNVEQTVQKLTELNEVGVRVAIDDFGTGYSSLSVLQKLPIDRLKIDRSFVNGLGESADQSIIEAIANMAKGLKLEMVAEGVEEDYQLKFLRSIDCPVVQGFFYSQAVTSTEARQIVINGAAGDSPERVDSHERVESPEQADPQPGEPETPKRKDSPQSENSQGAQDLDNPTSLESKAG